MTTLSYAAAQVNCSSQRFPSSKSHQLRNSSISSSFRLKPFLKELQQNIKEASVKLLDAFVDLTFEFIDQPLLPSQSNFAPVEEIDNAVSVTWAVDGVIPDDFTEGVYIRNGPNPLFGGLKSTNSVFGKSSHAWIEGEGMLHALYFSKDNKGIWTISYNNKYVQTDTFKHEKERKKPAFLPAIEGDSPAVLSAYLLNWLRFGFENKFLSNTNVFEHSGKLYSVAENYIPQEIDICTLETKRNWDINGAWNRPFTSHPKVKEKNLTGSEYSMEFPMINENYIGKENKFGYTQIADLNASAISGMAKYGGLAKLYFKERKLKMNSNGEKSEDLIRAEYHKFPENTFCSGAAFVGKSGGCEEDDGWIITYVHNEESNTSQVYIVDAKNFTGAPIAKITLPSRVPYGFHGAFVPQHH